MRKINGIKALQGLLKAEKNYWKSWDKLQELEIFGKDVELNLGFSLSDIISDMLGYEKDSIESDWVFDMVHDYIRDKYTLEEITDILLKD